MESVEPGDPIIHHGLRVVADTVIRRCPAGDLAHLGMLHSHLLESGGKDLGVAGGQPVTGALGEPLLHDHQPPTGSNAMASRAWCHGPPSDGMWPGETWVKVASGKGISRLNQADTSLGDTSSALRTMLGLGSTPLTVALARRYLDLAEPATQVEEVVTRPDPEGVDDHAATLGHAKREYSQTWRADQRSMCCTRTRNEDKTATWSCVAGIALRS